MCSIHRFKNLPYAKQMSALRSHGVHLDLYRSDGVNIIALYALEDFYVELCVAKSHGVSGIKSFSSTKKLAPYLSQVNIDSVMILLSFL
jgi:hypothetical protein